MITQSTEETVHKAMCCTW